MNENEGKVRYYWCVSCGGYGDFKYEKQRNLKCTVCDYDALMPLNKEEYSECKREKQEILKVYENNKS